MAITVFATRTIDGLLRPATQGDAEAMGAIRAGDTVKCEITKPRNLPFHRKGFSLLKLAFDLWCEQNEMPSYKGERVRPDFNRFRKDLTIVAGFYTVVPNILGEPRMEADSLNFASMGDERFAEVYSAFIDVILSRILGGTMSREELEAAVERVMGYA